MASTLDGTQIEIVQPGVGRRSRRSEISSVLFDFDGTLSLIRQGWQGVMVPMMVEILAGLGTGETEQELTAIVTEYVDRLTGKQTIYQMIELYNQVAARGGRPRDPLEYKRQYLDRLWARIEHRVVGLKEESIDVLEMVVPGTFDILKNVRARGLDCYLASGTDQPYVLDEAAALGLTPYFATVCSSSGGGCLRIYGALDEYKRFSKAQVIQDILRTHGLRGSQLLAFGDGFVEIEETKRVGGIAVGVATDEAHLSNTVHPPDVVHPHDEGRRGDASPTRNGPSHGIDAWKRERLIQAGADIIIPDFQEQDILLKYLLDM
jgi:phosphoglycolate phosphatase